MVAFLVALADANVPVQADGIPEALLKKLQPGKISGFLCLGNVGPCVIRELKRVATDMRFVAGDNEEDAQLPSTQVGPRGCSVSRPATGITDVILFCSHLSIFCEQMGLVTFANASCRCWRWRV